MNEKDKIQIYTDNQQLIGYMCKKLIAKYTMFSLEDMLQELRILLWKCVDSWDKKKGTLSTYYFHVASNRITGLYRYWTDNYRLCNIEAINYESLKHELPEKSCYTTDKHIESLDIIRKVLGRYDFGKNKDMIYWFYLDGLTTVEIAKKKGRSRQAVFDSIRKSSDKMRREKRFLLKYFV